MTLLSVTLHYLTPADPDNEVECLRLAVGVVVLVAALLQTVAQHLDDRHRRTATHVLHHDTDVWKKSNASRKKKRRCLQMSP